MRGVISYVQVSGAPVFIITVEVSSAHSEKDMVVDPFVNWANAMETENFAAGI